MGEMYFLLDIVVTSEDFWAMGMRGIRIKKKAPFTAKLSVGISHKILSQFFFLLLKSPIPGFM